MGVDEPFRDGGHNRETASTRGEKNKVSLAPRGHSYPESGSREGEKRQFGEMFRTWNDGHLMHGDQRKQRARGNTEAFCGFLALSLTGPSR